MSEAVNPYASNDGISGTPPPVAVAEEVHHQPQTEDPGAVRKKGGIGGFFSAMVSKETWSNVGNSTADAAKKAYSAVAKNKTVKHLTKGSTWADKEKVRVFRCGF